MKKLLVIFSVLCLTISVNSQISKPTIKSWFMTGLKPTQQNFWDLIDNTYNDYSTLVPWADTLLNGKIISKYYFNTQMLTKIGWVDTLNNGRLLKFVQRNSIESDPFFNSSVAKNIKPSDTTRWAQGVGGIIDSGKLVTKYDLIHGNIKNNFYIKNKTQRSSIVLDDNYINLLAEHSTINKWSQIVMSNEIPNITFNIHTNSGKNLSLIADSAALRYLVYDSLLYTNTSLIPKQYLLDRIHKTISTWSSDSVNYAAKSLVYQSIHDSLLTAKISGGNITYGANDTVSIGTVALIPNDTLKNAGSRKIATKYDLPVSFAGAINKMGGNVKSITLGLTNPGAGTYTMVSGTIYFALMELDSAMTIHGVRVGEQAAGSFTASGYNGIGIYTVSGSTFTKVKETVNDPALWTMSYYYIEKNFATPYVVSSKCLIAVALSYNSSAETTAPVLYAGSSHGAGGFTALGLSYSIYTTLASQTTLPSTVTATSNSNAYIPVIISLY